MADKYLVKVTAQAQRQLEESVDYILIASHFPAMAYGVLAQLE